MCLVTKKMSSLTCIPLIPYHHTFHSSFLCLSTICTKPLASSNTICFFPLYLFSPIKLTSNSTIQKLARYTFSSALSWNLLKLNHPLFQSNDNYILLHNKILEGASVVAIPAIIMVTILISPRSVTSKHCDRLVRTTQCSLRISWKSVSWMNTSKRSPSTTYNVLYSFLYFLKCRKMGVIIIADIKSKKNMTRK